MDDIDRLPGWRGAAAALNEQGLLEFDAIIPADLMDDLLGVAFTDGMSYTAGKAMELRRLSELERLKDHVLKRYLRLIEREVLPDGSAQFRVLRPLEQTQSALRRHRKEVAREHRRAAEVLINTDTTAMSAFERARHEDSLARVLHLRAITRQQIKGIAEVAQLPPPKEDEE